MKQKKVREKNNSKSVKKLKSNKIVTIAIITSVIAVLVIGYSIAKYFSEIESRKKLVESEDFYFTSNYLTEESDNIYTISNYSVGDEIIIDVYNYEDELRYTIADIIYNVSSVELDAEDLTKGEFTGTELKVSQIKVTLQNEDFIDGKATFTIKATATDPYDSTLAATFNVYQEALPEDAYMYVVDSMNSYVVTTTVTSEGREGIITVYHPNTLVPDMGDDRILERTDSYFTFQAEKNSIYEFILFKENLDDIYGIDPDNGFAIYAAVVGTERLPLDSLIGMCDDLSLRDENSWGSYDKYTGGGDIQYVTDENGNIGFLGNGTSSLTNKISVDEPVNDYYSINTTIKVDITKNIPTGADGNNLGGTVVAISPVAGQQITWIAVKQNTLRIYSYQYYSPSLVVGNGFMTIDITEYDNKYMNITVTGEKNKQSKVYINGELISTFNSGNLQYQSEPELTIGDLRPGRMLYFEGVIYNFALYNKVLSEDEIQAVWNYYNKQLKIEEHNAGG